MIGVFDSGFWGLQTLKYLIRQFPHEDFIFLADNANVPYWDKNEADIKRLTIQNINRLFDQGCHHVIIACNTAVASVYKDWFQEDLKKRLIAVTRCGVKESILYNYQKIAVFCTQATHDLKVYPTLYQELQGQGEIYTIPTPELVPLLEDSPLDRKKIYTTIEGYYKYLAPDTDALVLGCTHYPIVLEVFWELFPQLKIIDPGRSTIFTLDKRICNKSVKKNFGRWSIQLFCTGSIERFHQWASKIWKGNQLPNITQAQP